MAVIHRRHFLARYGVVYSVPDLSKKKKTVENWQNTQHCQFSTVLGQKGVGQILSDMNFETIFGILSSRRMF